MYLIIVKIYTIHYIATLGKRGLYMQEGKAEATNQKHTNLLQKHYEAYLSPQASYSRT